MSDADETEAIVDTVRMKAKQKYSVGMFIVQLKDLIIDWDKERGKNKVIKNKAREIVCVLQSKIKWEEDNEMRLMTWGNSWC